MPKGGNLSGFDTCGKRSLALGRDIRVIGGNRGVCGSVAAGEEAGDQAGEAQGSDLDEITFGA
jgi:hypothetical protein